MPQRQRGDSPRQVRRVPPDWLVGPGSVLRVHPPPGLRVGPPQNLRSTGHKARWRLVFQSTSVWHPPGPWALRPRLRLALHPYCIRWVRRLCARGSESRVFPSWSRDGLQGGTHDPETQIDHCRCDNMVSLYWVSGAYNVRGPVWCVCSGDHLEAFVRRTTFYLDPFRRTWDGVEIRRGPRLLRRRRCSAGKLSIQVLTRSAGLSGG